MTIEEILIYIKNFSLPETLKYIISEGIDIFKTGYEKVKDAIKDKQNKKRYLFVPIREEALKLQQFSTNPQYKELTLLVPNYKYLDLIRTGLLLDYYGKNPSDKNNDRIKQIKMDIRKNPGGKRLLKIVNLPSTQYFSSILKYLYDLKVNNYPENHIEEEFNELTDDFQESSIFVENIDMSDKIIAFCKEQNRKQNNRFFILARRERAVKIVEEAIEYLKKDNFFKENYYKDLIFKNGEGEDQKIEIIISSKDL